MSNINNFVLHVLLIVFCFAPAAVLASSEASVLSAMKDRVPDLVKAKDAGEVGEQRDGLVGVVKSASDAARKLAEEENTNRRSIYEARAKEQGQDLEVFMRVMGDSRIDNEKPGRFIQKFDGSWAKKN